MKGFYMLYVWCACVIVIALPACIKEDEACSAEGYVAIRPDNTRYRLPAMTYWFYPADGTKAIGLPSDAYGNFKGVLPEGAYRVIAVSAGAPCRDMQNFETALVYLNDRSTLPEVYSVVMESITVVEGRKLLFTPEPNRLTHTIILIFTLNPGLNSQLSVLSGSICGLWQSRYLHDGHSGGTGTADAWNQWMNFTAASEAGMWQASLNLLGMYDPGYGDNYSNVLKVGLTTGGITDHIDVSLTSTLSDIIARNGGVMPAEVTLHISLDIIALSGSIRDWIIAGTGTGEI